MISSPTISVVMPVFNGEKFLRESIESVLNQTYKDFEFLIIYDKSTDSTASIIQEFEEIDSRICVLSGDGGGIIGALNIGIRESKGTFIARHDADDISLTQRLEIQYKFIMDNKLDICGGDFISIGQDGLTKNSHIVAKGAHEILLTMASNVPFAHPSVMIKKSFLINHKLNYGAFGHKNAEDLDLWMQMHNKGAKFGNVDSNIIKYRLLSNSLSSVNSKSIKREVNCQFNKFLKHNHEDFRLSLELFCKQSFHEKNIQRVAIKALFRYLNVDFNFKLLYKCFRKVSLYNFLFGLISYINSISITNEQS